MTNVKHPVPSDLPPRLYRARSRRTAEGIHAFDTEARSLEQAVDLIAEQQRHAKIGRAQKGRPMTLAQERGLAKGRARRQKLLGMISLPGGVKNARDPRFIKEPKRPHGMRGLPLEQKRAKVREFYESGCWGIGIFACRRLAQAFGVPIGQILTWVEGL